MGAKVQSKTYFPGSVTDLNNGFHNNVWDLYHGDKNHKISSNGNNQHYDFFLTTQAIDGYNGYAKEQIKQTILKHESIFKHQLQELHRLYKRQKDLMNPIMSPKPSKLGHFLNQAPSDVSKDLHAFPTNFHLMNSSFSRASTSKTENTVYHMDSIRGKGTLQEFNPLISKCDVFEKRVIDLEQPADVDKSNKGKIFNLADLNEPVHMEERETTFSAFFGNKIGESTAKKTLFGIEIGERNRTPLVLPWRNTSFQHNNWLNSFGSTSQSQTTGPGFFDVNSRLTTTKSRSQNEFVDLGFLNGFSSKDSVPDKHRFLNMWKNHETPEQKLPSWLTSKPCLQTENIKTKETNVHHINLDSLQNHSQQFFKKTENADTAGITDNNTNSITKILGVPIIDKKVENHSEKQDNNNNIKHHIDLNLSLDEEDGSSSAPSFPESVVKIATMEIDLEAPAVLEPDPDDGSGSMDNTHMELVNNAAEAIVSISLSQPPASNDTLLWFAEVVTSNEFEKNKEFVPEDMDYFEYMTLKLEDTKEIYNNYKPIFVEEQKEDKNGLLTKTVRKGQGRRGRQRKDFQKDILPSIISLSRREVSEDLQIFEEALSATGVSWQSSTSKRKAAARSGRGRRRLVAAEPSCSPSPPAGGGGVEVSLEKSLEGWGRRTRRLPRQRCQNGGNHNQTLAMKC